MQESGKSESRQVIDVLQKGKAAKTVAGRLWADDVNNWVVFAKDNQINTGKLIKVWYEPNKNRTSEVQVHMITAEHSIGGAEHAHHILKTYDEVWVAQNKPKVTVGGVYLEDH
ncbi:hypothetical protein SEA_XENIA2_73 [Gordonia phage Xenia2]